MSYEIRLGSGLGFISDNGNLVDVTEWEYRYSGIELGSIALGWAGLDWLILSCKGRLFQGVLDLALSHSYFCTWHILQILTYMQVLRCLILVSHLTLSYLYTPKKFRRSTVP